MYLDGNSYLENKINDVLFLFPALGKPQALISEDDLKQKLAAQTGVVQRNSINEMQTMPGENHEEIQASGTNNAASNSTREFGKKGMVLPFQPLAMAFDNVNYFLEMPQVR